MLGDGKREKQCQTGMITEETENIISLYKLGFANIFINGCCSEMELG